MYLFHMSNSFIIKYCVNFKEPTKQCKYHCNNEGGNTRFDCTGFIFLKELVKLPLFINEANRRRTD